jgi:O-acetyl-ADP-ribose deacetylase (regulator of RNase III)
MATQIIIGDALKQGIPVIHQVNCQGKMGSGITGQIRERFPNVYTEYRKFCDVPGGNTSQLLGKIQCVSTGNPECPMVVNLFAQDMYGYDGSRYTSYDAFYDGFKAALKVLATGNYHRVAVPYKIGCALGGGDWNVVYAIIQSLAENMEVIICDIAGESQK